ncbi:MAG: sce7726 family protein [Ignavibacteriaceae bacterium]|nr:sce7726 family protein [Ignavibacteriaceae bacterium]
MRDPKIRQILKSRLTYQYSHISDTIFWDEFEIRNGLARIDLAVINGSLLGYEIKSRQDNLTRLPRQVDYYNSTFEKINIIVETPHIEPVFKIVSSHWGIWQINESEELSVIREAKQNDSINYAAVAALLKKEEMVKLLCINQIKVRKNGSRDYFISTIIENTEPEKIGNYVRAALKSRFNSSS